MSCGAALVFVILAISAAAQSPMPDQKPEAGAPPDASTATVSASSSTASMDDVAGHGFKVGGDAPKAKLTRPMHVRLLRRLA